ncbi:MAG: gamma-glutamyltransferase [Gemmatimonadetes bacterium]|nr:gamma-glutamyltransferase [Gemmatimonadota bacterium]
MTRAVRRRLVLAALVGCAFAPLAAVAQDVALDRALRTPVLAPDGRIATEVDGDLWIAAGTGAPFRPATRGGAWDMTPSWSRDGRSLLFASDRGGQWRIHRLALGADGAAAGDPTPLTTGGTDVEPAELGDGRIVFVRGRHAAMRLWVREADGTEKRLTAGGNRERRPRPSPDGTRLAYVEVTPDGARLRVRTLATSADRVVLGDRDVDDVAWAPSGDRLVVSAGGARAGTVVVSGDGRVVQPASAERGDVAWSADGRTLLIAVHQINEPDYNGDPDRLGLRVSERLGRREPLVSVAAPAPLEGAVTLALSAPATAFDRATRNAEALDRAWERTATLYYANDATRRSQWEAVRERHRARVRAAATDSALDAALHAMLAERPPLRVPASGRAVVSSAHPVATEAGLEVLRAGGNVVEAAIAVSFALGVVEPDASGVAGYGQMLVHKVGWDAPQLIEFMGRVPEEASLSNASFLENGRYPSDGPVLPIVPGTVAGMHKAFLKYGSGKVTWKALVAPAIRAARDGYVVSEGLATTLRVERDHFAKYAGSRALFFRNGEPLAAGDTIRNPDLAWVLEQVADRGADGFYKGEVARRLVMDLRGQGNAISLRDMARYYAAERTPVKGTYRGYTLYSSAPPVSGGAQMMAQLNALENVGSLKPFTDDPASAHAFLSAWLLAPTSRGRIADPGLWPVDLGPMLDKDSARARWRCFDAAKAPTPRLLSGPMNCGASGASAPVNPPTSSLDSRFGATSSAGGRLADARPAAEGCDPIEHAREISACRSQGTTSFAVADADGNMVVVTQTLGTWGGTFYVTPGLGFLYNDKLTSFSTNPDGFGARLPNARHGSVISPTIVFRSTGRDAKPVFGVGAAGNGWITSAVYAALVGRLDWGLDPQRALELPRVIPGGRAFFGGSDAGGFTIEYEDGFAPGVIRALEAKGWELIPISLRGELRMGYGAAVAIEGRTATAGADPRRAGAAGAVP